MMMEALRQRKAAAAAEILAKTQAQAKEAKEAKGDKSDGDDPASEKETAPLLGGK
jgi:hypothetical protein